jgi:hypothetical protein
VHNPADDVPTEYRDFRTVHSVTHGRVGGLHTGDAY